MAREKKSGIDELKDRLYSREEPPAQEPTERSPLSSSQAKAPVGWSDIQPPEATPHAALSPLRTFNGETPKRPTSMAAKFLIGSGIFFVLAVAVAAGLFFYGGNTISPQNIDLQVLVPSVVDGGKPTNFEVLVGNRNSSQLQSVDLVINYPDGTRDATDETQALSHETQQIGSINPGQQVKKEMSASFSGQQGTSQKISVTLEYSIAGSDAVFRKDAEADFITGSSPVSVTVSGPTQAVSGQQFSMDITVASNATDPVDNLVIQGQYPPGYSVASSDPSASAGGTLWRLGTLSPGQSQTIHLTGTLTGQDGDNRVFHFLAGQDSDQTDTQLQVPFLSVPQAIVIERPFIGATITVNGKSGTSASAQAGQPVTGSIVWQNNLSTAVSDVQLSLAVSGPPLDQSSVHSSSGFYQSSNSSIVWTKNEVPALANVPPGGQGTLDFSFSTLAPGSGGTVYANPAVSLNLTVSGVGDGGGGTPQQISSVAQMQVQLSSLVSLEAQAEHFSGPFQNSGAMPPKSNTPTTYTIVWTAKNSSNTIANTSVSATLPTYVSFVVGQPGGVTYNSATHTVTWSIGDLKAGAGYSVAAPTTAFEVVLNPSTSQVGTSPVLTSSASLSGQDRFAQVPVSASADAPTIALPPENGYSAGMGQVTQ